MSFSGVSGAATMTLQVMTSAMPSGFALSPPRELRGRPVSPDRVLGRVKWFASVDILCVAGAATAY